MRVGEHLGDKIRAISLLCSLLICLNHTYTVPTSFAEVAHEAYAFSSAFIQNVVKFGLARISTPFFFAVAGFMLFHALFPDGAGSRFPLSAHRREVTKRMRSLLIPFVVMSLWSFGLIVVLQSVPGLPLKAADPLAQRSWAGIAEALLWNPVAYPLWFVRNLFLLCLAAPLFALVLRYRTSCVIAFACAVVAWFMWSDIRATRSILFFGIGAFLAMYRRPRKQVEPASSLALLGTWLGLVSAHSLYIVENGVTHPWLNNGAIIIGLMAVWFGYDHVERWLRSPSIQRLAAYTFFIYIVHEPMATLARKAAIVAIGPHGHHGLLLLAWPIIAMSLWFGCLSLAMLLSQRLPWLYAFIAGGRRPKVERDADLAGDQTVIQAKAS